MFVLIFLLLISSPDARSSESVYPQNLAITTGEPLSFLCGTPSNNETVIWKVRKMGSLHEDLISNGLYMTKVFIQSHFNNGFSSTGNSLLSKKYSTIDDAGTYRCIRTGRDQSVIGIGSAHLLVFGSKPECSANANSISEGENLSLWCRMNFSGSLNPVTECSGIGVQVLTNVLGSASVNVFTKQMSSINNGKNVTCTVYFKPLTSTDDRLDAQKAVNAPEYKYQWIYRMNILFGPKSIDIDPRKEAYLNDEVIRCVADGNPSPVYAWMENGSAVVLSENSTLVVNEITMASRTYECTARNTRGSLSTSITIHILKSDSNRGVGLIPIMTIVAGIFCVVLAVIIIAITVKRISESCQSSSIVTGPDIVLNAEDLGPLDEQQPFDGYSQAEDLGLGRPFIRYAGNGVTAEARREVPVTSCTVGTMQPAVPIYDEINSDKPTKACGSVDQLEQPKLEFPVYGKVSKASKVLGSNSSANTPSEEFPVYGKVQKKTSDNIQDFVESCDAVTPAPKTEGTEESKSPEHFGYVAPPGRVITGADGTQYLDMSGIRSLMQSENQKESSAQSPKFSRSEYAQIDHSHSIQQ